MHPDGPSHRTHRAALSPRRALPFFAAAAVFLLQAPALAANEVASPDAADASATVGVDTEPLARIEGDLLVLRGGQTISLASLPAGETLTLEVFVNVDSPLPGGTTEISSQVSAAGANFTTEPSNDPATPADDDATVTGLLVEADLAITKTDGATASVPGDQIVYTLVASNNGPSAVGDAAVADTFAAPLENCTFTSVAAGGASGNTAAGSGNLAEVLNLPSGASVTYTVTCDINPGATGTVSNTATIQSSSVTDPVPGNNSASDTNTLSPSADVGVTKTNGTTTSLPGAVTVYTIVASNAGPSTAPSVTLNDTFPAILLNCSYTSLAAGGATGNTASGSGDLAETLSLPPSSSVTYTATCQIDPGATGSLTNTATVSSTTPDPDGSNASATDTDTLEPTADLRITKDNGTAFSIPGTQTTYTIQVSNTGPSAVPDAAVVDVFPPSLLNCTYTSAALDGATGNTASGSGDIGDTLNLPLEASVTYTATCDIAEDASGTLSNTATVTSTLVQESDSASNSASDRDNLRATADAQVTKTNGVTEVFAGLQTTYTIVATNLGPSASTDFFIDDTFDPSVLENCTYTSLAAGGATGNTASGTGDISDDLDMPAGASVTYTATCDVRTAATGTLVNAAEVTAKDAVDPVEANDLAIDTDTIVRPADLEIEKSADVSVAGVGDPIVYTLDVTNAGPGDAQNVVISDALPAGITVDSTTGCLEPVGVPTCTLGSLALGASAQATIRVTVDPSPPSPIVNTASVAADNFDPDEANNSDDAEVDTDSEPPTVLAVTTNAGPLEECATQNAEITTLTVVFSEALSAAGGGGAEQADDPANYVLVAPSFDRELDTLTCDALSADDRLVTFAQAIYAADAPVAGQATATLELPINRSRLQDDPYRLLVCGTLQDLAGNELDGNADGLGGDDFEIYFRVDRNNRFANGSLDCELVPWQLEPDGTAQISQSGEDFEDASTSGSAQVAFATEESFGLSQCVELDPAENPQRLSSRIRVDAAAGVEVVAVRSCQFFDQAGCVGGSLGLEFDALVLGDTSGAWIDKDPAFEFEAPPGTASAACEVAVDSLDDAAFNAFVDALYVGRGDGPIFLNGFESGGVTLWSDAMGN
ncbi:MAG: hypothetical protein AAF725_18315 [Acidobacteriota bacterium]